MGDIFKGIVITLVSMFVGNLVYTNMEYVKYPVPQYTSEPTPTSIPATSDIVVSDGTYYVWSSYEDAVTYHSDDYSYSFRKKFAEEHKYEWMGYGDKYKVLQLRGRFLEINIIEKKAYNLYTQVGRLFSIKVGWIKI